MFASQIAYSKHLMDNIAHTKHLLYPSEDIHGTEQVKMSNERKSPISTLVVETERNIKLSLFQLRNWRRSSRASCIPAPPVGVLNLANERRGRNYALPSRGDMDECALVPVHWKHPPGS